MSKDKKEPEQPISPSGLNPDSELPPDADLEERFNDFWKNNGAGIFGGIAVGAVAVVGIQLFQYMGEQEEGSIREAFQAAQTMEAKATFIAENPDHQLAALAELQLADARFEEGAFAEAAGFYGSAAKDFIDPTLSSRALLGQGMSLIKGGDKEAGRAVLESVSLDPSALDQTRAEAAYHLAVSYWEDGNIEQVEEATNRVIELGSSIWSFRATSLRDRLGLGSPS